MKITKELLQELLKAVCQANKECLDIYKEDDFGIQFKADNSPVTRADLRVNDILTETLMRVTPEIPVVSEEANPSYVQRRGYHKFWIIDPIDGTKEFIKKSGEFTINLGLVENGYPTFGIISIPTQGQIFYGGHEIEDPDGTFKRLAFKRVDRYHIPTYMFHDTAVIKVRSFSLADHTTYQLDLTCSKDHHHPNDWKFSHNLAKDHYIKLIPCGSTIKICRIAEGSADIYIRMSGINDWDLAAGHAIVEAAGGRVTEPGGQDLQYNTESQRLKPFVVCGGQSLEWSKYL